MGLAYFSYLLHSRALVEPVRNSQLILLHSAINPILMELHCFYAISGDSGDFIQIL